MKESKPLFSVAEIVMKIDAQIYPILMKQKETQSFDAFHKKLFRNELKPAEK